MKNKHGSTLAGKEPRILVGLFIALVLLGDTQAQNNKPELFDPTPGWAYYQQYCASCHGANAEGGGAGALQPGEYEYGESPRDIFKNIRDGIEQMGMPAYGDTLSEKQIHLLVGALLNPAMRHDHIREQARSIKNGARIETLDYQVLVETWADGLNTPWGMEFLAPGLALITEKRGTLRVARGGKLLPEPVAGTPEVVSRGQGGLLDVEADPDYPQNGWIYLSYSHLAANENDSMTRVVRGRLSPDQLNWIDQETVWEAPDETYVSTRVHYGNRLNFGPDGMLYICIGERGVREHAQEIDRPNGKIHRVYPDGRIPQDNPFVGVEGAMPSVWSYGHRNPQGMSFHPLTGDLWEAEHGPRGGDELNIIKPGINYGWPHITYGINYSGSVITRERVRPGLQQPVWFWRPSIAVCGIEFYTGDEFPFWRNQLLVTSLANQTLRLLHIQDGRVIHEETLLSDRGRIRDAVTGPDGAIYLVMNGPDCILRLTSLGESLR